MTISEIAALWKKEHFEYVKASTVAAYELILRNHVIPLFGNEENIDEGMVQDFVRKKLDAGLSVKSINDAVIVIKMILKFGAKRHWCEAPIDWKIRYPSRTEESKRLPCWNVHYQKKMIDYLKEHFDFRALGVLITMETGMRIGEVAGLRWSDFDLENKVLYVNRTVERIYEFDETGKGKTRLFIGDTKTISSNREIPLSRDLLFFIRPLLKICVPDYYVTSNSPRPCEPRTYRNYYRGLCKKAGVPYIKFHGLRHTFATRLIDAKCDIKTVSALLGHANITTTLNIYVHPDREQKKNAINAMLRRVNSKKTVDNFDTSFLENNKQSNEQNNEK